LFLKIIAQLQAQTREVFFCLTMRMQRNTFQPPAPPIHQWTLLELILPAKLANYETKLGLITPRTRRKVLILFIHFGTKLNPDRVMFCAEVAGNLIHSPK